ncbi:heterokaryon incompatibility protein-domain-containing protein [Halenospora varia]|nr:heterokaryon incompatibility protein-domain-containing protein [Halenospora varia]
MAHTKAFSFPYQSLDTTVRLLRVTRGSDGTSIIGHLDTFLLDSPNCPPFKTIAYWGTTHHPTPITLNAHPFPVFTSLYPYLELITSPTYLQSQDPTHPPQYHWIDSICINQRSPTEGSPQVSLMKRIYQQALTVHIYLGPSTLTSKTSLCFIRFLAFKMHEWKKGDKRFQRIRSPRFAHRWKALDELLLHLWWQRVWMLQEFIVATECSLWCGEQSVTWQELISALYALYLRGGSDGTLVSRKAFNSAWNRKRIRRWYTDGPTSTPTTYHLPPTTACPSSMIAYIGDSAASDDRYCIYSLLGMISNSSLSLISQPNYELSVESVFANLVMEFVKQYSSLDVICFSHLFNYSSLPPSKQREGRKLPTWVPGWRAKVEMEVTPVMASQSSSPYIGNFRPLKELPFTASYAASGTSKPHVSFSKDMKALTCKAVMIDVIDGLGGHPPSSTTISQSRSPTNLTLKLPHEEDIFITLARTLLLNRSDRDIKVIYAMPTPDHNHHVILRTPIEYCTPTQWCEQNSQLMVKGSTWVRGLPPPVPPGFKPLKLDKPLSADAKERARKREKDPGPDALKGPTSFLSRFRDTITRMQRRLFVASSGTLGMGPARAQPGDLAVVVLGCSISLVLRKDKRDEYELIGEAYLDGFMSGEVMEDVERGERKVVLLKLV